MSDNKDKRAVNILMRKGMGHTEGDESEASIEMYSEMQNLGTT